MKTGHLAADAETALATLLDIFPQRDAWMERLGWSFYRGPEPFLEDDEEALDQVKRFSAWSFFLFRIDGRNTLADIGIRCISGLSWRRRAAMKRWARVLCSHFRVERIQGDVAHVVDTIGRRRDRVRLTWPGDAPAIGSGILGILVPEDGEGRYRALAGAVEVPAGVFPDADHVPPDPAHLALLLEASRFNANIGWIETLGIEQWREVYDDFAGALRPFAALPAAADLEARTRAMKAPSGVLELIEGFPWATSVELEVFAAFHMRLWNLLPRAEFGGLTPPEHARRMGFGGPEEKRLIALAKCELERALDLDQPPKALTAQANAFAESWPDTPRDDLGSRTPRAVIDQERATRALYRN